LRDWRVIENPPPNRDVSRPTPPARDLSEDGVQAPRDHERVEEALRWSEERLRTIIDYVPVVLFALDREGVFTLSEGKGLESLGSEPGEAIGRSVFEVYRDVPNILENVRRALAGDAVDSTVEVDGSVFETWYSPLRDESGEVTGVIGVAADVTKHKRAETEVRRLSHYNRTLFEANLAALMALNPQGTITDVNKSTEEIMGLPREKLIGTDAFSYFKDPRRAREWFRDVLSEGAVRGYELDICSSDGRTTPVAYNATVYRDEKGELVGVLASARDITERKRSEEALRKSEQLYRAVVEQAAENIIIVDLDTKRILEANAAVCASLGYAPEELKDMTLYDIVAHDRKSVDRNIERIRKKGHRSIGERRYRRKDGSVADVEVNVSSVPYRGREAMCVVAHDVTERKRTEEALKESEERFRSLIRNASDVITILETDGIVRYDSPAIERVLGYRPEERVGKSAFEYIHPDDVERVKRTFTEAVDESGVQPPVEFRIRHKDGSWRHVEVIRSNLLDDPLVRGVVANSRDITERKEAEEALAEERNLLRTLIDNMPDFIFVKDVESRFVINNAEHLRVLGATQQGEVIGKTDFDIFSRHLAERYYANEQEVVKSGRPLIDREEPVTASDGNERWLSTTKVPLRDSTGRISGLVGISRDITERRVLEEQLKHQAFHDPLTALPNRALFLDRLGHALARSRRLGKPVAVLFVDLDDFKLVNDSLGHEKGDLLLVEVAERLASCVRPGDTVARIFGDEFGVLLEPPTGVDDARRVAERMQERLQEPFGLDGREMFVSSSVGITIGEPDDRDADQYRPEDLLRRADLAMYVAKRRGKNRCEAFSPSMDARVSERMELENDLRRAIEREEFAVHYQPIVELRTGRIKGLEALARWRHPERGLLDAEEFLWFAEETGLIRPIGQWVFEEVCRQAHRWNERHPDNRRVVSVNFSVSQFAHQADLIPKVLSDTGLDPRALVIEITERAVMDDAEFALGELRRLKDLGVSFGIDDYGTGYSCLSYLKLMPVDFLKIDRSFIAGLGEDPGDEAIVSGTIDLAHALGLRVVAEGVETADQLRWLKEHGCDLAQGGYLFKPLAEGEIPALGR
jgi:diguanylate cyclase (GGDEF)-like protein/PAS domain S-box-containing protein